LGIVNGVGNGNFAPERSITRAEAARMLALTCSALGLYDGTAPQTQYTDQAAIRSWARPYVNFVAMAGIMTHTSSVESVITFSPTAVYTVEQSIVTFERMRVYVR